jgi:hypothetical protein
MRILIGLAALVALGATAASAKPAHLSDAAYLEAARCVGLASSKALGGDAKALSALLQSESSWRQQYILEKGDEMQRDAKREADRAGDMVKPQLQQELAGVCQTLKG